MEKGIEPLIHGKGHGAAAEAWKLGFILTFPMKMLLLVGQLTFLVFPAQLSQGM